MCARLVGLPDKGEALEGEHRRVREADAPRAEPAALGLLRAMQVPDSTLDRRSEGARAPEPADIGESTKGANKNTTHSISAAR